MSKKAWLYFFIIILAAGAVAGGRVWGEKSGIEPALPAQTAPSPVSRLPLETSSPSRGEEDIELPDKVLLDVPFTAQAPLRQWSDPRQQDGCEEAAILMAAHWIKDEPFVSPQAAKEEILALSHYQDEKFGFYQDTSAEDTAKLLKDYFGYDSTVTYNIVGEDLIKKELAAGNLVIVPVNGRKLNNPYYTPPGPDRHMIVIVGYDEETSEFITNDAGIMRGKSYRYPQATLMSALRDYPSGRHEPFADMPTAMIVAEK